MRCAVDRFTVASSNAFARLRLWASLCFVLFLSGCATFAPNPPQDQTNVCEIFREQPSWYDYAQESEEKWGTPIATQMSFIQQESSFRSHIRPDRKYYLGFIPGPRPSSAKGYAQAQDPVWGEYEDQAGSLFARRTHMKHATDFIEGLDMLASMRLCSNVQGQYAIQTAMGGYQSMKELTSEKGRLFKQREMAISRLNAIPGISCTMPQGAFYCFPKMDPEIYPIKDDMEFMMDLLIDEKVLMVQGTGFNWDTPDHFRLVFLPNLHDLENAMDRLDRFFAKKRQQFGTDQQFDPDKTDNQAAGNQALEV